jgi:hypothetical protein
MSLDTLYTQLRFWLPMVSGFAIVVKAYLSGKKSISGWASTLLDNHLHTIQTATSETVAETKRTNELLSDSTKQTVKVAEHVVQMAASVAAHQEKEMRVWDSVTKTMAVLEDRTRSRSPRKKK